MCRPSFFICPLWMEMASAIATAIPWRSRRISLIISGALFLHSALGCGMHTRGIWVMMRVTPASVMAWVTFLMHLANYMVRVDVLDIVGSCQQYDCGAIEFNLVAVNSFAACRVGAHSCLMSRLSHIIRWAWESRQFESPRIMAGFIGAYSSSMLV